MGFTPIKTIYDSNFDIIRNIMDLYKIDQFDLDCTYSKGNFWKKLPQPKNKTDLFPINDTVTRANTENLPFNDSSMKSIMYDPPFIIASKNIKNYKEGSGLMSNRFHGYLSYKELKLNYYNSLKELYRICDEGGFLIFKCQDTVSGGKNCFTHVMVMNMAQQIGFYPKDLFILLAKNRIHSYGTKWPVQLHARKYHSYFWVFQKVKTKVNYDVILQDSLGNLDTSEHDPLP
jgi:hypothetical protein